MNAIKKTNGIWFPNFHDDVLRPDLMGGVQQQQLVPAVNIRENETGFILDIAVPGKKKEDIQIEVDRNILTISSDAAVPSQDIKERYTRREFNVGGFKRSFTLPKSVSDDKIQAQYADGVLQLTLPKREEALPKPKRSIEIG